MENETEKETAVSEGTQDVEMETNDTTDAVAASEPQATTDRDTTTSTTPSEEPGAAATATTTTQEEVDAEESVAEEKPSRIGCNCQGSCLVHTCACFVEGHYCEPSICKCCDPAKTGDASESEQASSKTATSCQNNDEQNFDLRKQRLIDAMRDHPEAFWSDTTSGRIPTPQAMDTEADAETPPQEYDPKIWASIEDLVKERLRDGNKDAMDIENTSNPSEDSNLVDLSPFESDLEFLAGAAGDGLARKLVGSTSKDVLAILKSIATLQESKPNAEESEDKASDSSDAAAAAAAATTTANESTTEDAENSPELELLLCTEEFPEEGPASDGSAYFKNLDKQVTNFTTAGNSDDPMAKNLMCQETGFFDGDDSEKDEKKTSNPNKMGGMEAAQQLALIQETTRMVRAKTLELAKRRLKRRRIQ